MRDDERALLRAVCEAPDDDVPRLVYADWLDEHGDPARAAFIRAQCWFAQAMADPNSKRDRHALQQQAKALFKSHGRRWRAELPRLDGVRWGEFRRGFPSSVWLDSAKLAGDDLDHLLGLQPVSAVTFRYADGGALRALLATAAVRRLHELTLDPRGWLDPNPTAVVVRESEDVATLTGYDWPHSLAALTLDVWALSDWAAEALASVSPSRYFPVLDLRALWRVEPGIRDRLTARFADRVLFR